VVPTSSDDVVINSGTPEVTGADAAARSLTLTSVASSSPALRIADHTLTVSASGSSTLDGFIEVDAGATLSLGDPTTYEGTVDSNGINVSGTVNIASSFEMTGSDGNSANNAEINDTGGTPLIHILPGGSLVRDTSTGTQTIEPRVDNDGTVSVQTGTLNMHEGDAGTTTGSYAVSSGATLEVSSSSSTFDAPSISGSGTLDISGSHFTIGASDTFALPTIDMDGDGTLTLNKDLSLPTLVSAGGHRDGSGTLTVTGTADFSGLQLDGGTTTVAASVPSFDISSFLTVGTGSGSATLNLDTPTTYSQSSDSNGINLGDAVVNIASTFTLDGAGIAAAINDAGGSPVINVLPTGSIIRNVSSGTQTVGAEIDNLGSISVQTGTLDASSGLSQTGGSTSVAAGATLRGQVTLDGGTLSGDGTLDGSVNNTNGTVAPGSSPGILTITGDYSQGSGGVLAEEITGTVAGSQFDQLQVGGGVTLDGTLAIDSTGFTPAGTDKFKIIGGAVSRSGTFATVTGAMVGSLSYAVQYDPDGVTLTLASLLPVNTGPPMVSGTPAVGQTLSCSDGVWTNAPTGFGFQWNRDGVAITDSTGSTYTVQAADHGHMLTCAVTASNAAGAGSPATSAGVAVPPAPPQGPPVSTAPPEISGTPTPPHTLTCSRGAWSNDPTGYSFQWYRSGQPIPGATGSTYVVQISDEAQNLTCVVIASNPAGSGKGASSGNVLVAVKGTTHCPQPTGRVGGLAVGPLSLGMTRAAARRTLHRFSVTQNGFDNFCLTPAGASGSAIRRSSCGPICPVVLPPGSMAASSWR
jgi:hypothetical protein